MIEVITPTTPSRFHLLPDAMNSVAWQTAPADGHLVGVDYMKIGPGFMRNALCAKSPADWFAFLDDDDMLDPCHLEKLIRAVRSSGADVAYSQCRYPPNHEDRPEISQFDESKLRQANYIPVTVLIRASLFRRVGGFRVSVPYEDWHLWLDVLDQGAKFVFVPEVTWTYRLHGSSWVPGI